MAPNIRWLHLSDFHVGKDLYEQKRLFAEILLEIERWKTQKNFVPNYVFITGDIANRGLKREYEAFRKEFLVPLQEKFNADTVVIPIPGNHDIERPSPDMLDHSAAFKSPSKFFDASKEGKTARDQVLPRFKHYKKLMAASGMSPDWLASNDGAAVHIRTLSGVQVGVVGLNTAWLCKGDLDKDWLSPGYRIVEAALKKIKACPIKIVLGHHPLTWWADTEERNIRSLFSEFNVIYLHGHKHKTEGRFEEGGVDQFLVLQAGSAFQAREDDIWANGFSWGELDPVAAEVKISPWRWVNREWRPDVDSITLKRRIEATDWWRFPVPGMQAQHRPDPLAGWQSLDSATLESFAREITPPDAQRFFDGAEPDWALAMSPNFPVRAQAKGLLDRVMNFKGEDRPQVVLVLGPTAEGKSMVLRQIVAHAVRANPDLRVLWHQDETVGINIKKFEELLTTDHRWLIATDYGNLLGKNLVNLMQSLKRAGQSNVQFVMAAHDSDWKIAKGDTVPWNSFARFEEARLSGLSKEDAIALATTWLHFGSNACESAWQSLTPTHLAEKLREAAKDDGTNDGALFGALLTLRHGRDLHGHVRALMQKFDGMSLSTGGTVGDAFRLIASMHAEGLEFLSSQVLQESMNCDQTALKRDVLRPMTAEAAAGGNAYLRTRHRRIALATLEVCRDDDEDVDRLYLSLVKGAIELVRIKGGWLDAVWNWEYSLTKHFFETNRKELAIRISEEMLKIVPDNTHYVVNLARLKRESNDVPGAIRLLEAATPSRDHRAFWLEWGVACGRSDDYVSNAALNAYSISDDLSTNPPTLEHGTLALAGLTRVFAEQYKQFQHSALYRARAACAWLGLCTDRNNIILSRELQQTSADIDNPKDVAESISWLCAGLACVLTNTPLNESIAGRVGNPAQFKFNGLQLLLERHR
ncbi:metallophosphoesterase [Pelomonas sp. Root1237]|uniref:metallophosphoesterase n=1 Tax=Pelomonas sp. Root1237 TaxID=1736434 RepID=UPI0009EC4070|nr:metallophosphoesterase [Pelomonas sp. Root1237]